VTEEEALAWLREQIERENPRPVSDELERTITSVAAAMAAISKMEVADEVEPYFP
jgi:hypothetical protein